MAGPTGLTALLRYAKRCGVNASLRGLMSGAASALIGNVGPDRIVETLSAASGEIGDAHAHYFSFGGLADTARYASAAAQARAPNGRRQRAPDKETAGCCPAVFIRHPTAAVRQP